MKLNLTEQQLFDYISCPCKYDMIYNRKIVFGNEFSLNKIMQETARFFFVYVLNNFKVPSFNMLSNRFESLCRPYQELIDEKKCVESLFKLRNFYNWACSNKIAVFDIDTKYVLSEENIILEGVMNPLTVNQRKQISFLDLNFSSRNTVQIEADNKLKYSLDMYAYNNLNKDNEASGINIHNVKSGKDIYTGRFQNDYDRLIKTINNVAKGISAGIYYPRESHACSSCPYKNYCRAWGTD